MRHTTLEMSDQTRAIHTVLGLLLLVYSGIGVVSDQFFAVVSHATQGIDWRDPVSWLMMAATVCAVAVLASVGLDQGEEDCARSHLRRQFTLLFQGMGWVLFFAAAFLYVHRLVLGA